MHMKVIWVALGVVCATLMTFQSAMAVAPSVDELATARQWAAVNFERAEKAPVPVPGLEVVMNHNPVHKNGRFGKPLKVGEVEYAHGLFCHAQSRIIVHLPGPAQKFTAVAGMDNNSDTSAGQGSVIMIVSVAGKEAFRSEVMHGAQPGVPVSVELNGATEFVLEVNDAGDGISADQADWADAKVVLADGKEVWLADLPMAGSPVKVEPGTFPFSFTYDGKPSSELLPKWKFEHAVKPLDPQRVQHTVAWTDPDTKLIVLCMGIEYLDFPTVEWTLYFNNNGDKDTPILENIQALVLNMERGDRGEFLLHHWVGSPANGKDYGPQETALKANETKRIGAAGGRPTNSDLSYFNIESTVNDGLIAVVGWPGQWAMDFVRDEGKGLHLQAGQELTHFKLLPGEEVRSPLIVLQFWKGDWVRAQNVWRRWMMAHSMPKPGGELPKPQLLGCSSRAYEEMIKTNTEKQIMFIDRYLEEKIGIDYWWMDAGWYVQNNGWPQVGTWEVDPKRFPNGLRPISDHAHANGIKILVWFEPERVAPDTWLTNNQPQWILGGKNGGLLNLGDPSARQWLTNHIDKLLTDQGIDLYRQDFNMDPLSFWRGNDAEDRQGITEIKHITGYLAYWDELRRRHPNMLIDSCASGGRRNDLETMRRAAPLWRSDYAFEPHGHQGMTYGISFWIPFQGTGTVACVNAPYYGGGYSPVESYAFWSNTSPSINFGFDMRVKEIDYAALRTLVEQWRTISPNYYGDYYPLTKYSIDPTEWIGWQFDRPEAGQGMVQVFRRKDSIYRAASLPLHGLDPDAAYSVTQFGAGDPKVYPGREILETGLPVDFSERPAAAVFVYNKVP
ncbi:MAG TPA: alpha-galactosidase [Candidatus Hydrogenedentes bacterium]|nr:alpha-galactosidase [Candidatus Hydrogenedentota bacterium]